MDRSPAAMRVAMYAHDTLGVSHVTRTIRLAQGILGALPTASVLILAGSPVPRGMRLPDSIRCVELPRAGVADPGDAAPRKRSAAHRRRNQARSRMLRDTVRDFRPHLFVVDSAPLGAQGELRPTLDALRRLRSPARIWLTLADVLDDPEVVRERWERDGVYGHLNEVFEAIHVFGERATYDAVQAYGLPEEKTRFLGYVAPPVQTAHSFVPAPSRTGPWPILVTTGGGGDGVELLHAAIELQWSIGPGSPYRFDLITGPFLPADSLARLRKVAIDVPGVEMAEYLPNLHAWMPHYDAIVSTGGYNTTAEIMARARRSLLVPRTIPTGEQELRARALERRGIVRVLPRTECTTERFGRALQLLLETGPSITRDDAPPTEGVANLQEALRGVMPELQESVGASKVFTWPASGRTAALAHSVLGGAPPAPLLPREARAAYRF